MKSSHTIFILGAIVAVLMAGCSRTVTSEDWQQDLRTLEHQLAERHVDLYGKISREAFAAAADELHEKIPSLTPPEILVGMAQLVAMVGDGHTSLYAANQKNCWFRFFPIKLYAFPDGFYLTATTPEYAHLFGKRLVAIDQTPIEDAVEALRTTVGADNDMEYLYTIPFDMIRPEMLHVLGIARSPEQAEFVFEDGTRQSFHALTKDEYLDQDWLVVNGTFSPQRKSPSMRMEFLFATPLTLPHLQERKYYWYTVLEDHETLFLQYNACWDQKDRPPFAEIVAEISAILDARPVERLVIDLRQNTGGEPLIANPLVDELSRRSELGVEGRIFVLVGRRTFSAAVTNAAQLRSRAKARIVGEPPRGKPNSPSEGRDIDLDRTGVWATVSTQFVMRDPELGDAEYLPVEIEAPLTFDAYQRGVDPVLDAALAAPLYVGQESR